MTIACCGARCGSMASRIVSTDTMSISPRSTMTVRPLSSETSTVTRSSVTGENGDAGRELSSSTLRGDDTSDSACRWSRTVTPRVMPTLRRRRFPPTSPSVRAARAYAVTALRGNTDEPALISDIELIVSELATNAVKYAGTSFEVGVHTDGLVRIDVSDRSPRLPEPRPASPTALSGGGLHLLEAICDRWGVEVHDDYKSVWCEKALR
jgi:anti-sigma regulatory factor (Ser/Thr protein kinase)